MDERVISAFLESAHLAALSQYRGLSVGVAIDAYKALVITAAQLRDILASLHVQPDAADLLIEYADFQRTFAQINSAVSRVRSLYTARKITTETARDSLTVLGIPAVTIPDMIDIWSLEASVDVKTLSAAEIAKAFLHKIMTQDEAMTELVNIGYTPFDAWVWLSVELKAALPNKPTPGVPAPLGAVIPGVT
jgi:hypothetical protein